MRKNLLSVVFVSALFLILSPGSSAQHSEKCLAEIMFWEAVKEDPSVLINRQLLEYETRIAIESNNKSAAVTKVIPVVFHVIHEGGSENISKAQLEDQIRILNEDFKRQNADTINTPVPFQAVAGNPDIEFRLATKDPNGNCTDGVIRVFSELTNNARNEVKALSYWPSHKYLNYWVVKSIRSSSAGSGIVIGFAQFPGGNALTDGIVVRADYTGSIGTATNNGDKGRVATHEVGHWLNLRHIWGDSQCGDDQVADTPQQFGPNQSNCPAFPKTSNCPNNGPNGDMFMNYMDYTNGNCQNVFSAGQSARMNAALGNSLSGRNNLWTQANLIATGTDDNAVPQPCAPIADFWANTNFICVGNDMTFFEGTWNGIPDNYNWILPGTTTGFSNDTNPTVQYTTPGIYDVTLIVSNAIGSDTLTKTAVVNVFSQYATRWVPDAESFETQSFPGWEWHVYNEGGNTWEETNIAAYTGNNSIWINNYAGNVQAKTDVFLTPAYNLTYSTNTFAKFWLAYALRAPTSDDQLRVFVSTSCGQFWTQRLSKTGTSLATDGFVSSNFIPTDPNQWRQETVNLTSGLFSGNGNVRLKFEYTHDTGNNIFIDDLTLEGVVGVDNIENASGMSIFPNPMKTHARLEFTLVSRNHVLITLFDVLGREIKTLAESELPEGNYHFDINDIGSNGVYYVKLQAGEQQMTKKIVVQ
jgi:PKD repeat protein